MAGPAAVPGMFILFNNCYEHTAKGAISSPKIVDGSAVPMTVIAKCAHVHCKECGCIKSRTECVLREPDQKKSVSGEDLPPRHLTNIVRDARGNDPFDYESAEIKYKAPEKIHFNIEWSYEGNDFFCSGNLPTDKATQVIKAVNS